MKAGFDCNVLGFNEKEEEGRRAQKVSAKSSDLANWSEEEEEEEEEAIAIAGEGSFQPKHRVPRRN